ncbi:MAG: WYL domain-containing protein [Cyanobacteria bacterium NC_groundwater_1444_Ag_S-0.65um_54_12]|nr:WYL domain-containing protein [Cyanobacteria bacterium NC_groundwater_1444_Ag_S-0.65um_54_12]
MRAAAPLGAKGRALARLLRLIPILLSGPIARRDLLFRLESVLVEEGEEGILPAIGASEDSTSTVNRDIRLLRELDLLDLGDGRVYDARPGANLPVWLTPVEAQALDLARSILDQIGVPESESLATISGRVPTLTRREPQMATPLLPPSTSTVAPAVWQAVHEALRRGRQMTIVYRPPDADQAHAARIDRAALMWIGGAFYLVGFRPDRQAQYPEIAPFLHLREYRLDRICQVTVAEETVLLGELPLLRSRFVVDAAIRGRLSTLRDPEGLVVQSVEPLACGNLRVEALDTGLVRARQRILSFGEHLVRVEDPPMLIALLRECSAKLAVAISK